MDKEIYEVRKERFHLYEPRKYILQGTWPKGAHMKAFLGGEQLPVEITRLEMVSALERFKDPDRIRGEQITAQVMLPEKLPVDKRLSLYYVFADRKRLWFSVNTRNLKDRQGRPQYYVEEEKITDSLVRLRGWAIGRKEIRIELTDEKGCLLTSDIQRTARVDVEQMFEEAIEPGRTGFFVELQKPSGAYLILRFYLEDQSSSYKVWLGKGRILEKKAVRYLSKGFRHLKAHGPVSLIRKTMSKVQEISTRPVPYEQWILKHLPDHRKLKAQRLTEFSLQPLISVVVPVYRTPKAYMKALIDSLQAQTYGRWELILSDGSGQLAPAYLGVMLGEAERQDARIHVLTHMERLGIVENTNAALEAVKGDYVLFADHDDELTPDALYEFVKELQTHPEARLLYADEDKMSMDGHKYFQPHFKPDYNEYLENTVNYICHPLMVQTSLIHETGLFDSAYEGAQDYDYILRLTERVEPEQIRHIPRILYHWRAHEDSTAENPESKAYAFEAGCRAVQTHYERLGVKAKVFPGEFPGLYRTRFIRSQDPLISIIIPNKDHIDDLKRCMSSIDRLSSYRNYEYIIVENNSEKEETFKYYRELMTVFGRNGRGSVVTWEGAFNFSAINNFGAGFARGEYLLLLNNDTEVISPGWLEEMLGLCMQEGIGAVGARLYYEDDTIQHAGVVIGFGGIAGHCFVMQPRGTTGYMHRIICTQEYSAVTAACMLIRRSAFDQVNGLSEELAVAFNDIDFCLKLREAGYRIIYAPYAELYHYESKSRGLEDTPDKIARFNREMSVFEKKWPDILRDGDPYYNPNLTLKSQDFSLRRI